MIALDGILAQNGFMNGCPLPLWKIKVTDDQYTSLKQYLIYHYSNDKSFDNCPKEAALYIAEWWKRHNSKPKGMKNRNAAFCDLGLNNDETGVRSLINNAVRIFEIDDREAYITGAKAVNSNKGEEKYFSLLFQGGIPLGLAYSDSRGKWRKLIEKFVRKNIDFGKIQGAKIAKRALPEYIDYLVVAAREKKPEGMPFACDREHPWYKMAVEGVRIGDIRREAHPFHVKWTFIRRTNDFIIRGTITGPSELRENFLSSHPEIQEMNSVPVHLYRNEELVETLIQYEKTNRGGFISYYAINYTFNYDGVSKISLRIPGLDKPILSSDVDMNIPHSFFRASNGQDYEMGSKFGERVSLLVFDSLWTLVEANGSYSQISTYFNGKEFSLVVCDVPMDDSEIKFTLKNKTTSESYLFGSELNPSWTEVRILRPYNPIIVEDICDFSDESQVKVVKMADDEDDGDAVQPHEVFFRRDKSDMWSNEIPFGKIQCSIIKEGVISSPERNLLSVGRNFEVAFLRYSHSTQECYYHISWKHGDICSADDHARPNNQGEWVIKRGDFATMFPIYCIPREGNPFYLHIRTKFPDFSIYTPLGEKLSNNDIIPWSEVNSYRYVINDINEIRVKPFNELSIPRSVQNANGRNQGSLPVEGSLGLILDPQFLSRYEWRADRGYSFEIRYCSFTLQRYPLSLSLVEGELILVLSMMERNESLQRNAHNLLSYFKGKLLILDQQGIIIHEIPRNEDGRYYLPVNIDGKVFIICNQSGYVRPVFYENDRLCTVDNYSTYSEILRISKLDDSCWDCVTRFLDTGLRYGLPLIDLPWIGSVIKAPDMFFALYCRFIIKALDEQLDPIMIRDIKNRMGHIISVYQIPSDRMTREFYLTDSCSQDCFPSQYNVWRKNEVIETSHREFLKWAADYVDKLIKE